MGGGLQLLLVFSIEFMAFANAFFGHENRSILGPRADAFGGSLHGVDDGRPKFRIGEHVGHPVFIEVIAAHYLVNKGFNLGSIDVHGACVGSHEAHRYA